MKAARCALFVLALYAVSNHCCVNGIDPMAILGSIRSAMTLYNQIKSLTKLTTTEPDKVGNLMVRISDLSERIQSFEQNSMVQNALASLENLPQLIQAQTLLSDHLRDLNKQLGKISRKYSLLREYADGTKTYENFTLNDFATSCVSNTDGVQETLGKLHSLVIPDKDGFKNHDVIRLLADYLRGTMNTQCSNKQSHQYLLYDLYHPIAVAEIKGLALMQFSYMVLKLHGKGNFEKELQLTQTRYQSRLDETLDAFRKAMSIASPDVWTCDPPYPIGNNKYAELQFVQSYMILNQKLGRNRDCDGTCGDFRDTEEYSHPYENTVSGPDNPFHGITLPCRGTLHDCKSQEPKMKVCINPKASKGGNRYDYVEYIDSGRGLGKKEDCKTKPMQVDPFTHMASITRWNKCEYCVCNCVEPNNLSDRFFSMRESVSNIKANRIVTGIRFSKLGRMIHLQVEQGDLLPDGEVTNLEWINVDEFQPDATNLVKFTGEVSTRGRVPVEGTDWVAISWRERAVDLDDVASPPGHCVTGVRLRKVNSHLRLEIRSTPFELTTGKLIDPLTKSFWHGNDDTSRKTRLDLVKPDRSTLSKLPSIPNFGSNQYVEFGPTDLEKDIGRSTVPFIDTQAVNPFPRVALAGAGLYHKGRDGYGGFIAPKLKTYNFGPHLHTES